MKERQRLDRLVDDDGLEVTQVKVSLTLTRDHFHSSAPLQVKCISSMPDVYLMTHETIVEVYNQDELEERARAFASEQITDHAYGQGE